MNIVGLFLSVNTLLVKTGRTFCTISTKPKENVAVGKNYYLEIFVLIADWNGIQYIPLQPTMVIFNV